MKSITPDRCQQELQEKGSCGLRLCVWRPARRFRVSIFKQRGNVSMVLRQIPIKHADAWSSWACRKCSSS